MRITLPVCLVFFFLNALLLFGQTNEWSTQYVTLDDETSGTGWNTPSVAVTGPNDFVALVNRPVDSEDIFGASSGNYLVGYVDADSVNGRVVEQPYQPDGQIEVWASGLDQVLFSAAWQIAGGPNNYVYVANNDENHNILVFELTPLGVQSTDFRMETGSENIFAVDVDTAGNVYVVDYQGDDTKTDEVKVFAPIGTPGTTWGDFGGHNDSPIATIDLPAGIYMGVAGSADLSQIFVSSQNSKQILKFSGDPNSGYSLDGNFNAAIDPNEIFLDVDGQAVGSTTFLGMDYLEDPGILFAAVDTFLCIGTAVESGCGGYVTGRIFVIDPETGVSNDTIDVAQWNLDITGVYNTGSSNGRAGGFTSVLDVDVSNEPAVYSQTYYGWAVEKWVFDGELVVSVEQIAETVPQAFALLQNYPNPFNPSTTIQFDLQRSGHVTLEIYNLLGQRIATLVDKNLAAGSYKAVFDASAFNSGVYFYKLTAGHFTSVKKMVLAK